MKYIASILALAAIILLTCYLGNRTTRPSKTTASPDTTYNYIDAAESQGYDVTIPTASASTPTPNASASTTTHPAQASTPTHPAQASTPIPNASASTPTHPDTIWVGDSDEGI